MAIMAGGASYKLQAATRAILSSTDMPCPRTTKAVRGRGAEFILERYSCCSLKLEACSFPFTFELVTRNENRHASMSVYGSSLFLFASTWA